jgi:hypothetical protein
MRVPLAVRTFEAVLLLGLVACSRNPAPTKLAPGQLVRVTASAAGFDHDTAYVQSLQGGTLVVGRLRYVPHDPVPLLDTVRTALALRDVRVLEVRVRRSNTAFFAMVGLVGGVIAGKNLGKDPWDHDCDLMCPLYGAIRIAAGASLGLTLGAFVGSKIPTNAWVEIPATGVAVGVFGLPAGRIGIGAAFGF